MSDESKIKFNLDSILESIGMIIDRSKNIYSPEDFVNNPFGVTQLDAITMRIQVIRELLKKINKISPDFFKKYKDIDWEKIIKMRDLISHHYDIINPDVIFDICKNHIPQLNSAISKMIEDF
jgi:uncharacterized protein with HEPN domain